MALDRMTEDNGHGGAEKKKRVTRAGKAFREGICVRQILLQAFQNTSASPKFIAVT